MLRTIPNRRFTAVIIGKKLIVSIATVLLAAVVAGSLWLVGASSMQGDFSSFHKRMASSAIPVVAAADDITLLGDLAALVRVVTGLDVSRHISNFGVLPYFCCAEEFESLPAAVTVPEVSSEDYQRTVAEPKVAEQTNPAEGLKIKNETTYNVDAAALLGMQPEFDLSGSQPQILVLHTHGTESYTQSEKYRYSDSDSARCEDIRYNVVRVGEELTKELQSRGFNVLHDKTLNDYPSYNSSYNKALGVIENYLQQYPSIQCVFDIHRDAVEQEDGTRVKFTADINGEKVSQVMLVCGSDGLGLENPDWQHNLSFALKIQNHLNDKYPGLMRPVNLRKERFNLHKTRGSLIFEFGTHGNTMDEALGAVKYVAEGIDAVLKQ